MEQAEQESEVKPERWPGIGLVVCPYVACLASSVTLENETRPGRLLPVVPVVCSRAAYLASWANQGNEVALNHRR